MRGLLIAALADLGRRARLLYWYAVGGTVERFRHTIVDDPAERWTMIEP